MEEQFIFLWKSGALCGKNKCVSRAQSRWSTCKQQWPVLFSLLQRENSVVHSNVLLPFQGVFAVGGASVLPQHSWVPEYSEHF